MNPFLLTVTFLMLLNILTTTSITRYASRSLDHLFYTHYTQAEENGERTHVEAYLHNIKVMHVEKESDKPERESSTQPQERQEKGPRKSVSLKFNEARPPTNSRLNFYSLLHEKKPKKSISHYELSARLLRRLYQDCSFFQKYPRLEHRILNALLEKKEETLSFHYPDDLATLLFEDEVVQECFYKMLKGEGCPSLLHYISFAPYNSSSNKSNYKKINLMFASEELLEVIFENNQVLATLLDERDRLWEIIDYEEAHRSEFTTEQAQTRTKLTDRLTAYFDQVLQSAGMDLKIYKPIFDFTLGHQGDILFSKDPITGITLRKKILPS